MIGRNKGERLQACLGAAIAKLPAYPIVYVDFGLIDGNVALVKTLGIAVVEMGLGIDTPPNAAIRFTLSHSRKSVGEFSLSSARVKSISQQAPYSPPASIAAVCLNFSLSTKF